MEALVTMVEIGEYPREDLYQYFNELFKTLEQTPIFLGLFYASVLFYYIKIFSKRSKAGFQTKSSRRNISRYGRNQSLYF